MTSQQGRIELPGRVYLVGAGPGDPDLLTLRAARVIQSAGVVVYDRLISDAVLDTVPHGVSRIYVGKRDGHHHMRQEDINQLLVKLARAGHRVVRLKGGDPFVFGRGSEEALHLVRHGVPFEIVPGLTAATACSAYAGIPLTHRELARSVAFIAGRCAGDLPAELDWGSLANPWTTVVLYMGMRQLDDFTRSLVAAGRDPATPAAVIENGTLPEQRICSADLATIADCVAREGLQPPALVIIGEVVAISEQLRRPPALLSAPLARRASTEVTA